MGRCPRLLLLLGVALCGRYAAGRRGLPPPQSQAIPPEALRVTTRLVTVSVVVKDAQGKPVTDLGKDDFVVLEESQPQKIDIDPSSVTLLLEKGAWIGCVYVMLMQQKADGTVISKSVQAFDLRFSAEERQRMEQNGLTINHEVRVEASAAKLRVVVCDLRSGAIGDCDRRLRTTAPHYAAQSHTLCTRFHHYGEVFTGTRKNAAFGRRCASDAAACKRTRAGSVCRRSSVFQ